MKNRITGKGMSSFLDSLFAVVILGLLLGVFIPNRWLQAVVISVTMLHLLAFLFLMSSIKADTSKLQASLTRLSNGDYEDEQDEYICQDFYLIGIKTNKLRQKLIYYSSSQKDIILENCKLSINIQRDKLTQLYNRRYLEKRVNSLHAAGNPFAVMFLDIDHFKKVNDTYGHGVGDEILKLVAQRVMRTVRPSDIVARYGGRGIYHRGIKHC